MQHENEAKTLNDLEGLLASLPTAARVLPQKLDHLAAQGPDHGYDAEFAMTVGNVSVLLLIQVKKNVFPRDAREVTWRLRAASASRATPASQLLMPFVAAQSISEGARQVLMDEAIGYCDAGGSLYLPVPSAYVFIDRPPSKAAQKTIGTIFSGKRAQVVHAILAAVDPTFGVNYVAHAANVSPATASETLSELERLEWVASHGNGPAKMRYLNDKTGLLDAWRKDIEARVRRLEKQRYYVPGANADSLRLKLAAACDQLEADYELTGEIAAQEYAPHLSSISRLTCRFEPGAPVQEVLDLLGAKRVSEGANLELIDLRTGGELVAKRKIDGIWYASPVQVYLDLIRSEGRGRDAAEHLRQEVLRY